MIDINKKLDKIEKNCYELAKREYKFLKEDNDNMIIEEKEQGRKYTMHIHIVQENEEAMKMQID